KSYAARLEWLRPYGASALFAAGGTGEFFSLEPQECSEVIKTAISVCRTRMPIIAAAGGGTTLAIKYAQEAEEFPSRNSGLEDRTCSRLRKLRGLETRRKRAGMCMGAGRYHRQKWHSDWGVQSCGRSRIGRGRRS